MDTHIAPVIAPEACARLALLRDLADAADIILRDQQEIHQLEDEISTRTARLEELRASVDEGLSLYREATGQLGLDPTGLLEQISDGALRPADRDRTVPALSTTSPPSPESASSPPTPSRTRRGGTSTGERILAVLEGAEEPIDAREIAERSGLPLTRVRPALTQLKADHKIIHAGSKAVDHTRRRASLYRVAGEARK